MIKIKKGLNIPLLGEPLQKIDPKIFSPKKIAIVLSNYKNLKPLLKVGVNDEVQIGQILFTCKKNKGLVYTSPAAGKIKEICRGEKRALLSLVIQVSQKETQISFSSFQNKRTYELTSIKNLLLESGLWTSIRTRPYSQVARVDGPLPHSFFISLMDTQPHAVKSSVVLEKYKKDFKKGVEILSHLPQKNLYLCQATGDPLWNFSSIKNIQTSYFSGPHPAGNIGTHIHFLEPASEKKIIWHMNYQDVIAVGKLFSTGKLWNERIISLAGPMAIDARLVKSRIGANVLELVAGESKQEDVRIISGSVLYGRKIIEGPLEYLDRFASQISILSEDKKRSFLGWNNPGLWRFSVKKTFLGWLFPNRLYPLGTSTFGDLRAMVPIGSFEGVMPMDLLITPLLRALLTNDIATAKVLGILELDEEDLALCTFVCQSKIDYGPLLRSSLSQIQKGG